MDNPPLDESLEFCSPRIPRLQGRPFMYHACFMGNTDDSEKFEELRKEFLEAGFFVYEDDNKICPSENIQRGMERSMKVFILFTRNFAFFDHKDVILDTADSRAEMVSPWDVIVLRDPSVPEKTIKDFALKRLEKFRQVEMDLEGRYQKFIPHFVAELPELSYKIRPNLGWAYALGYYRYLSIILPELKSRIKKSGFMEGVQLFDTEGKPKDLNINDRNMSHKFFIVMPESLKGLPKFNDLDDSITDIGKLVFKAARGGHPERDYSSYIHQIKVDQGTGERKEYLFLGEVPAILINLYDLDCMEQIGFNITASERLQVLQQFHAYLLDLLEKDDNCRGLCSFIYQRDSNERISQPIRDLICGEVVDEIHTEVKRDLSQAQRIAKGKEEADVPNIVQELDTLKLVPNKWKVEYIQDPEKFYDMFPCEGKNLGQVLVINNKTFSPDAPSNLGERAGAEQDEEDIVELFMELNFRVTVYRDLKAEEMRARVTHFAADDKNEDAKAAVVVIMTHGLKGQLYGVDGEQVSIVEILESVGHSRMLHKKPKLFFIEACQSENPHATNGSPTSDSVQTFTDHDPNPENDKSLAPSAADILASYATLPGKKAYRDRRTGTLYIQQLCKFIRRFRRGKNLTEILHKMSEKVQELAEIDQPDTRSHVVPRQRPFYISSLNKSVALVE